MSKLSVNHNQNLALVAMHGPPEAVGIALQQSTLRAPIDDWDIEIANQHAVATGLRYVKHNVATAFPGNPLSEDYELNRPFELLKLAACYKTVLDIHDQAAGTGEHVVMDRQVNARLLGITALLGVNKIIIHPHGNMMVNHAANTLTVELCRGDTAIEKRIANNVVKLRQCMGAIANNKIPEVDPKDFIYYERVFEIRTLRAKALGLQNTGNLAPFDPIPSNVAKRLGQPPGRYVAEHWNGNNSSNGEFFGGVLREIPPPLITQPYYC